MNLKRQWALVREIVVGGTSAGEPAALVAQAPPVPIREVFRRFWPYTRARKGWLTLALVLIALTPLIQAGQIYMFKPVIDRVLTPRNLSALPAIAAIYVGLTLAEGIVSAANDLLTTWVGGRFVTELRTEVFRHVQGLSLPFFEGRRLGDILSRLTGDTGAIENFVLSGTASGLSYLLQLLVFVGFLVWLSWQLALVALVVTPMFWAAARYFSRRIKVASREQRRRSGSVSAVAEESLANAALVQAYNRQDYEVDRFHRENEATFTAEMSATRLRAAFGPLIDAIELAGGLVVIAFGTWQLSRGLLTLGELLVFLTFLSRLYSPIRGLSRLTTSIYAASASAERIIELLDEPPGVPAASAPIALSPARGAIELDHVSFRYPGKTYDALSDVSLAVGPGQSLALVGPSGAGKSTVAKLLLRFYDPDSGAVRLDGIDLRDLDVSALRANIAVVLQETLIFDGTVANNIAYGRPDASPEEVVAAARAADAHEFIVALPDGYETTIGQRGRRLSGGQRQRLAIARAMVRDAPVLILDEPTTGLDHDTGQRILEPLRRLMAGRTTIVISHNLLTVRDATEIVVIDHGRVVERGDHAQLLAAGGPYARLYRQAALAEAPLSEEVEVGADMEVARS